MGKQSRKAGKSGPSCLMLVTRVGTPGLEGFDLTGFSLVRCESCGHECLLSPRSRDVARAAGLALVAVCSVCGGGVNAIHNMRTVARSKGVPLVEFL